MDGVTVGHPRCHAYRCTERLQSPRDRHCNTHRGLDFECAINGCSLPTSDGKRTCDTPAHRQFEQERREKGQAFFNLKRRIESRMAASQIRSQSSQDPTDDLLDDPDINEVLDDPASTSNVRAKLGSKQPKIKSSISRRWTHNEQILVRPCGIVIARATFFEAESLPNCRVCAHSVI